MTIKDGNINLRKEEGETLKNMGEETREEDTDEEVVVTEETRGVVVERLVNDEYKEWKSSTPFLYDLVVSHAFEWPSLTVEWLPDRIESSDDPYSVQEITLGTYTTDDEPNYLIIVQVKLPLLDDYLCDVDYGNCEDNNSQLNSIAACKIQIQQQILHDGEVHRARHMPQDASIIATKTNDSKVCIFDRKNHSAKPPLGGKTESSPDLRLMGHDHEGFGLSWCNLKKGLLLSGSYDSKICLWDINQIPQNKAIHPLQTFEAINTISNSSIFSCWLTGYGVNLEMDHYNERKTLEKNGPTTSVSKLVTKPVSLIIDAPSSSFPSELELARILTFHKGPVEDVAWHLKHYYLFASCSADRYLHIYDLRSECTCRPVQKLMAHQSEVTSLSFNPFNEWLVATGSTDTTVKLFDLRKFVAPLHTFKHHTEEVIQIGWSPHEETILASSCTGRRVMVWDASRIGEKLMFEDREDGPPELLFIHGGHTDKVPDFSWNPSEDWLVASVANDNVLQVWQMADRIYSD